ncbi:hypothetical protein [Malacoplasma muris]|uniref:hypothetical protein n=1 Tax=Malacoplasma muris TaxID=2119 RepID=UPI00398E6331
MLERKNVLKLSLSFLVGSVSVITPLFVLTSCKNDVISKDSEDAIIKHTEFFSCKIDDRFVVSNGIKMHINVSQFKNFPSLDRNEIVDKKLINSNLIFDNIDLFVKPGTHNITSADKIIMHALYIDSLQNKPTISFAFYFVKESIYANGKLNQSYSPIQISNSGIHHISPLFFTLKGDWINEK